MTLEEVLNVEHPCLIQLFSTRAVNLSGYLKQQTHSITQSRSKQVIVMDVNHSWDAKSISNRTRVLQPRSRDEVIRYLLDLYEYLNPRLGLFVIDNLPLYFRDFQGSMSQSDANMTAFAFCLSILKKLTHDVPIVFSSYSHGFDLKRPIMEDISLFYCDKIYQVNLIHNEYSLIRYS